MPPSLHQFRLFPGSVRQNAEFWLLILFLLLFLRRNFRLETCIARSSGFPREADGSVQLATFEALEISLFSASTRLFVSELWKSLLPPRYPQLPNSYSQAFKK